VSGRSLFQRVVLVLAGASQVQGLMEEILAPMELDPDEDGRASMLFSGPMRSEREGRLDDQGGDNAKGC
jgi:hypothetical protein